MTLTDVPGSAPNAGNPTASATPAPADPGAFSWDSVLGDKAADLKPMVEAKGWKNPVDALSSYKSLEALVGRDKIALPGKDAKPEEWDQVWNRLGRPEKADGYEFKKPEGLDGYDDNFAGWAREAFHKAGMTKAQAAALHDAYLGWFGEQSKAGQAAQAEAMKAAGVLAPDAYKAAAQEKWGAKADETQALAARATAALKLDDKKLSALEAALGSLGLVETLASIGAKVGEDTITGKGGAGVGPAEALAEIAKLNATMSDPKSPLMDKMHPEHRLTVDRMTELHRIASRK